MSAPEFKSCLDCLHYVRFGVTGHLCTLPPECAPLPPVGSQETDPVDAAAEDRHYVGTVCDVMRRMGALCGPRAALWEAKS